MENCMYRRQRPLDAPAAARGPAAAPRSTRCRPQRRRAVYGNDWALPWELRGPRLVGYHFDDGLTCTCYLANTAGAGASLSPDGANAANAGACYATRPSVRAKSTIGVSSQPMSVHGPHAHATLRVKPWKPRPEALFKRHSLAQRDRRVPQGKSVTSRQYTCHDCVPTRSVCGWLPRHAVWRKSRADGRTRRAHALARRQPERRIAFRYRVALLPMQSVRCGVLPKLSPLHLCCL